MFSGLKIFSGFSRIDLVYDKVSKTSFALKRISCHSKNDENKALREANFQLNLPSHPNLLRCIASGLHYVTRYEQGAISEVLLVLSYSKRGTLQGEIDRRSSHNNPFPLYLIKTIMSGICEGLIALLSLDVPMSHSPGNVLLFEDMRPVLMDFGSATPATLRIEDIREAEKWKSLGCLLYALIFFKSPMDLIHTRGDSVALAACSANIPFPKDSCSNVFPGCMMLIKSMLTAKPQDRISFTEISDFFKNLPDGSVYCNSQNAVTYSF
ncbi:hypothetical protein MN116_006213 [Schistosoma mekongi]|uniref:non-specific serine/threonine protein kinase n=1 Tax=Schistosoma mekongi TaxID=38744 RepID=A0AAE2D4B0_SCHME|nr:hypothetical protein MN116_006213 [Schistosoma mekongi]